MNKELEEANRRAAWRWGSFVVGLLGLQVVGGIFAIMLATGDQSVAVVPNYHQKALQWDQEIAIQTASEKLGWECTMEVVQAGQSHPGLRIRLTDAKGQPVSIVSGDLQIYRHVRAADVLGVALPKSTPGVIELADCFANPGLWQATLDVTDDQGHRFTVSRELNVRQHDELAHE